MSISATAMQTALRLTRQGRLAEATQAIKDALGIGAAFTARPANDAHASPHSSRTPASTDGDGDVIDVVARVMTQPELDLGEPVLPQEKPKVATPDAWAPPQPSVEVPVREPAPASFEKHSFRFGTDDYSYMLYTPGGAPPAQGWSVVVMLHGCKQDAQDFATGTGMNAVAEREKFLVLYPEQLRKSNGMGCWNWFEPQHQQRGAGEPALIVAVTQQVLKDTGADATRIYAAGLSAGGAMAALLGRLYPDVFAAVGVHSGLRAGAARDVVSAFSAMRRGPAGNATGTPVAVPTIVFHGTSDKTVAHGNAADITQEQLAAHDALGLPLTAQATPHAPATERERGAVRTTHADADGKTRLEIWSIHAGPHAWSGGHADGSFTDPQGPSASEAFFRFFRQHRLRPD